MKPELFKKGQIVVHKISHKEYVIIKRSFFFPNHFKVVDKHENNCWAHRLELTARNVK